MADFFDERDDDFGFNDRRIGIRQPRAAFRQPLPEEEFKSFGRKALDSGLGALQYVGGTLAKPGYAARGVLAGRPSALANLIPFSETLGITDEGDKVSGRDLTNMLGVTNPKDQGWGAWGAGLAADILTDPLTYVGGILPKGATTAAGRGALKVGATKGWTGRELLEGFQGSAPALRQAGKTSEEIAREATLKRIASPQATRAMRREVPSLVTKTVREPFPGIKKSAFDYSAIEDTPLAGLLKLHIPFTNVEKVVGTGPTAQKIAGGLDVMGEKLMHGNKLGRGLNALLNPAVREATGEATQKAMLKYGTPALEALQSQARLHERDILKQLSPMVEAAPANEAEIVKAVRAGAEGSPDVGLVDQALRQQGAPASQAVRQAMDAIEKEMLARGTGVSLGGPLKYTPRQATEAIGQGPQVGGKARTSGLFPTSSGANVHRKEIWSDLPVGHERINDWFSRFAGLKAPKGVVKGEVFRDLVDDTISGQGAVGLTPDVLTEMEKKAGKISRRLVKADIKYRSPQAFSQQEIAKLGGQLPANVGQPFLSPDLFADIRRRGSQHAVSVANQRALIGGISDVAQPMAPGLVPLGDILKQTRLRTAKAAGGSPMQGAAVDLHRALAKKGMGISDYLGSKSDLIKEINQYGVTPEHAKEFMGMFHRPQAGTVMQGPLSWIDSFNNAFKALAYPIWPASHTRNALAAALSNLREGTGLQDYLKQYEVMTGKPGTDALRRLQYGHAGIFEPFGGAAGETLGGVKTAHVTGERFTPGIPGENLVGPTGSVPRATADLILKEGLLGGAKAHGRAALGTAKELMAGGKGLGTALQENLGIRGVGGAATDVNPVVRAGRTVGGNIENFFRGALFNRMVRQGYTPEEAARFVDKYHFKYNSRTAFQKNVLSRVFPFGTFMQKNLPLQAETILHHPRVIQAQLKPFTQEQAGGEEQYTPRYLEGNLVMPLGKEEGGKQQYLAGLGTPLEEALQRFHFTGGAPDIRRTMLEFAGSTSPLIKGPLEKLSGIQFYTQRPLQDLRTQGAVSTLGRLFGEENPQDLAQLIANTPASRFVSSLDKLIDPRKSALQKAINLGTGARITDVDVEKQKAIDTRDAISQLLMAHPNISHHLDFFVRPENIESLTPEEIELMRAFSTQKKQTAEWKKAQQKLAQQKSPF